MSGNQTDVIRHHWDRRAPTFDDQAGHGLVSDDQRRAWLELFAQGSDAEVWNRYFNAWTFREGKIVRVSSHTGRMRALEAAGLRE